MLVKMKLWILTLAFLLSACSFQSKEEFEKEIDEVDRPKETIEMPEVTYKDASTKETFRKIDFEKDYKKAVLGENMSLDEATGFIKEINFAGSQVGFVLEKDQANILNLKLVYDDEGKVEHTYGPLSREDELVSRIKVISFDSESGPMLLVSQVSVFENESLSNYYLYNKYLSLLDSFSFYNTTEKIEPEVRRLDDLVESSETSTKKELKEAIRSRIEAENKYLQDISRAYDLDMDLAKDTVLGDKIEIGNLLYDKKDKEILNIEKRKSEDGKDVITIK
ncbi:MAG: hypothetical protein MRZ08_02615 [Anaerococcus sp.]|uniref:hypothetical protein n=1 Tax=Anaerococcus sp. TaxID=1872515 RepID=UPI0026351C43|nr:hypothetical protein [Anaerococcus sp.]MCI5971907.1 hypothetical protein [Anaerococcus sp.]MDD6919241.1 hypothetical protein [Peptoniphilaceae bacterium]MDY2927178.1 hypothetical protein [Anaerococcus sp.]